MKYCVISRFGRDCRFTPFHTHSSNELEILGYISELQQEKLPLIVIKPTTEGTGRKTVNRSWKNVDYEQVLSVDYSDS